MGAGSADLIILLLIVPSDWAVDDGFFKVGSVDFDDDCARLFCKVNDHAVDKIVRLFYLVYYTYYNL